MSDDLERRGVASWTCMDCLTYVVGDHDCPVTGKCYRQTLAGMSSFEGIAKRAVEGDAHAAKVQPALPANFIELHAVPVGEYSGEPLKIWIDPGNASSQEIADLLHALSQLHRAAGGEGLQWTIKAP